MTANSPDPERRLLPRWRTAAAAVASGELKTPAPAPTSPTVAIHFEQLLVDWHAEPTVETAAELVASAIVLGRTREVESAARLLAAERTDSAPLLRELSRRALSGPSRPDAQSPLAEFSTELAVLHAAIAAGKQRVRGSPKNPIAWMDLAHAHTVVGQHEKARRAVRIALALAPENRFVLRCAARFFVHAHDTEQALATLRGSRSLRSDPWVMAAEVALSTLAGQGPQSYKRAQMLVDADELAPWHTAELHGALGTLALSDRGVGKARKFFKQSLRHPTENAIAQAQWAANSNPSLVVPPQLLTQDHAFEAIALKARNERRWRDAVEACRQWSAMEPTSTRPLVLGGFMAEVALADGPTAIEFTSRLLVTAPTDAIALNNHIVALAYSGRLEDAQCEFEHLAKRTLSPTNHVVRLATRGLLAFRSGEAARGQQLYLDAFERAGPLKDRELGTLVLWHLLREEARIGSPGIDVIATQLWDTTKDIDLPELAALRDHIQTLIAAAASQKAIVLPASKPHLPPLPSGHFLHFVEKEYEDH